MSIFSSLGSVITKSPMFSIGKGLGGAIGSIGESVGKSVENITKAVGGILGSFTSFLPMILIGGVVLLVVMNKKSK